MKNIGTHPAVTDRHLGRDPLDAAFARLAIDHSDRCSTDADYPGWNPHVAHTPRAARRHPLRPRPHRMTVGDLKALLVEVPDWAAVEVLRYDETGCPEECDPHIDYTTGVLTIDAA